MALRRWVLRLLAAAVCLFGGAPWPMPAVGQSASGPTGSMRRAAAQLDQAGADAEAAATYEELVRREPEQEAVVAPRLVTLYTRLGRRDEAIRWAHRQAPRTPDSSAYLAGVYASLGQYEEALRLLAPPPESTWDIQLMLARYWQIADIQMAAGHQQEALATLATAARLATGTPHEAAAKRRLDDAGPLPPPIP